MMTSVQLQVLGALLLLSQSAVTHKDNPVVSTPLGEIKGSILTTVLGKDIYSFRGVRYAKAPINELRFQPPVPVEKWKGIYDATDIGPKCPQPEQNKTSEDCLLLNVYTNKLPNGNLSVKMPVLVFIHPGGFYSMGGTSDLYGPEYLLDQNLVLVTINHRLASLGFMSTGDHLAPGNNGLKDQVVALRWIQTNIASFGGDPNSVTISGNSAGGSSVTLHMVSKMSQGLFHKVIAMSGSNFGNWPVRPHQFELAQKQARLVGCSDTNSSIIVDCLKTKDAKEIGDTLYQFDEFAYDPIWKWLPVIEPDFGQERFLTDDPVKLVQQGKFAKVPVMTGITSLELYYTALYIFENESWVKEMDENFEKIAPISFTYERDTENSKHISRELRKFYLGDGPITTDSIPGLGKLYADGVIGFGVDRTAKLLAAKSEMPTYYYLFNYEGRYSFHLSEKGVPEGVVHSDDLMYIFYISYVPKFNRTDPEYRTVQKLTKILYNFALTGKPIVRPSPDLDDVNWDPFTLENNAYMDIGDKLIMKKNLYNDRYRKWEELFPLTENASNPVVTTPLGDVEGSLFTSAKGRRIFSFRGIRYAQAPIGELRFKAPVPVTKWDHLYDATKDGPMCPQPDSDSTSEDCLFLNVYTSKLPTKSGSLRPVLVYIHAGGFYSVTGSSVWAGPEYFLDKNIVLVTINYRLASLGFLSTGDKLAPGNNGLKDQVAALRWIRENIAAFGGNPNLVTICGYSAGGVSVTLHLVSPMSKGLFHRAVAMSGSALTQLPIPTHQFDLAQKQARLVGCPENTSHNIISCLKTKSAKELGDSLPGFSEFRMDPIIKWLPVIEPDFGQERFLVEHPIESIQKGRFVQVPVMLGITKEEFSYLSYTVVNNSTLLTEMDNNFETIAPIAFLYERDTDNSKYISRQLRKFYLGEGSLSNSSRAGIGKLYADGVIGFGVNRAAKLLANYSTEPVYYYQFTAQGRYSHFTLPGTPYGPVHHDDLIYMFYISPLFPKFNESYPEYQTVIKLTTLLANFALEGKPVTSPSKNLNYVRWKPFNLENNNYLDIGNELKMKSNLYKDRYDEWQKLFPLT